MVMSKFGVKSDKQPESDARKCLIAGNVVENESHLLSRRNSMLRDCFREDFFGQWYEADIGNRETWREKNTSTNIYYALRVYVHAYGEWKKEN